MVLPISILVFGAFSWIPEPKLIGCGKLPLNVVYKQQQLPEDIFNDLSQRARDMTAAGMPFQETDEIVRPLPIRRFVAGLHYKHHWIVVYEHGGWHHYHTVGYFDYQGDSSKFEIDVTANLTVNPCEAIKAINEGVRGAFQHEF